MISGDKYFQRSDRAELSEALYNLLSFLLSLKHALRNRDNFQQLILCCNFPPNLQVAGAEASEMEGKVPALI